MSAPMVPENGDFIADEWLQQRAEDLAAMNAHPLIKNSGTFDDEDLAKYLEGANIQGTSDFDGFSICFGFDRYGTDFLAVITEIRGSVNFVTTLKGML